MVKVAIKWNKRVFEDVEVAANVLAFKAKLQELTVSTHHLALTGDQHHTALLHWLFSLLRSLCGTRNLRARGCPTLRRELLPPDGVTLMCVNISRFYSVYSV